MAIQPTEYYIKNAFGEYEPVHFKTDAVLVKIEDTGGHFSNDNVEDVLVEISSDLAEMSQQIGGKADNTRVDNIVAQAGTDNTEIVDARLSSVRGQTFSVLKNRFDAIDNDICFMVSNAILNGNFVNTTNWSGSNAILSAASNILTVTGNGVGASPRTRQTTNIDYTIDRKIYYRVIAKVTNSNCTDIRTFISDTSETNLIGAKIITNPVQDQVYSLSTILKLTKTVASKIMFTIRSSYADSTTANGKVMQIQYALMMDLTSIFGAGKEPSIEQIESTLIRFENNWFNGSTNWFNGKSAATSIKNLDDMLKLFMDIRGTTQKITKNQDGTVQKIQHVDSFNNLIREDIFTYGTNIITEVRTLSNGATIAYINHTDTQETEVI